MMKKINNIPDKIPFKVPEGYFDEVNNRIIRATSGKIQDEKKSLIYHRIRPFLLAAASVAGFVLLSYTAVRLVNSRNRSHMADMTVNYSSPVFNDLDIYSIEENSDSVAVPEQGPDVSKSEIIDYLVFDNIDINEIYEQL
jgi:hypothetical protein